MVDPFDILHSPDNRDLPDGPNLVVVGVDATPSAWRAFAWACGHARRSHCPLVAVFVSGPSYLEALAPDPSVTDARARTDRELAEEISQEVRRVSADLGVSVRFEHHRGDPASVLLAVASDRVADLLVLGASAQGVHRIAGGLAGRLVRCRRLPVVVVP